MTYWPPAARLRLRARLWNHWGRPCMGAPFWWSSRSSRDEKDSADDGLSRSCAIERFQLSPVMSMVSFQKHPLKPGWDLAPVMSSPTTQNHPRNQPETGSAYPE